MPVRAKRAAIRRCCIALILGRWSVAPFATQSSLVLAGELAPYLGKPQPVRLVIGIGRCGAFRPAFLEHSAEIC